MVSNTSTCSFDEPTPSPFDFKATVEAHGWVALRPFEWNELTTELSRFHRLDSGKVVRLRLQYRNGAIHIAADAESALTEDAEVEIRRSVRRMLRLDEDLSEFYQLSQKLDDRPLALKPGSGRLLRCPRLFEDVIYTLCTTNIAWSGTKRMVDHLVATLGDRFMDSNDWRAFPTAEAIAVAGSDFLKEENRFGLS